jgi:hypothetical protein
MKRALLIASLAVMLQACARDEPSPSFLGAALLDDEDTSPKMSPASPHPDLRHVGSNKVLSAMAFQKVTGQAVDPSRLQNGR